MSARASLLAISLLWVAYQSQFNPSFFLETVKASLSDIDSGLRSAMHVTIDYEIGPAVDWRTASAR